MAHDTLQRRYKAQPGARQAVKGAAGYAVFSNLGIKILVAGSGNGKGIAVDNKAKDDSPPVMGRHAVYVSVCRKTAGVPARVKTKSVGFTVTEKRIFPFR